MTLTHSPDYVTGDGRGSIITDPKMSIAEKERLEIYNETLRDAQQKGYKPAIVVRLCPWVLYPNGPAHQDKRLVGVPWERDAWDAHTPRLILASGLSIPMVYDVIIGPHITAGTRFRGSGKADSYAELKGCIDLPIGLACDLVRQQNMLNSQGGIFAYEGEHLPQDEDGNWFDQNAKAAVGWNQYLPLPQAAEQAFALMIAHMKEETSKATDAMRSGDKIAMRENRGIRKTQCVHYLLNAGVLSDPPSWFLEHGGASSGSKHVACEGCRQRVEAEISRCKCGYIIDPFRAYGKFYDESSDGGLMTARRMTQEQLKGLGLYPRIKPLKEHLEDLSRTAEINRAAEGGAPYPSAGQMASALATPAAPEKPRAPRKQQEKEPKQEPKKEQ